MPARAVVPRVGTLPRASLRDTPHTRPTPALHPNPQHFADSLRAGMLLSLACCAVLQGLGRLVGEEQLELLAASLLR